uniref:glycosyltransferase family 2 protein n=1 Tax=Pedobacter sp. TaxID=1411316 RepID=UPI003D7F8DAE
MKVLQPQISVIVPAYNAEKSLERCLKSILSQSFRNFELVLVNDGSSDGTMALAEKYAATDPRLRIISQKNGGVSAARNAGMAHAKGDYYVFIDADDWVDPPYLEGFFSLGQPAAFSMVMQGYIRTRRTGVIQKVVYPAHVYPPAEFSALFLDLKFIKQFPYPFGKLFEARLIKEQGLSYIPSIHYGEDLLFILSYFRHLQQFIVVNQAYYHYVFSPGSLSERMNAYVSEVSRLQLMQGQLDDIHQQFGIDDAAQAFHRAYLGKYLLRTFKALYTPPHRRLRHERLRILQQHVQNG